MNVLGLILGLLFAGNGPSAAADSSPPPRIQVVQIPDRNLLEQMRAYIPDAAVTRTLSIQQFRELIERIPSDRGDRIPTSAWLSAKVGGDGRLEGEGTWQAPLREGNRWRFDPWNLAVLSVRGSTAGPSGENPLWGVDGDSGLTSGLTVVGVSPRETQLRVSWRATPRVTEDDWLYSLKTPATAAARLDLSVPAGRELVAPPATIAMDEPGRFRLFATRDGEFEFRIVPAGRQKSNVDAIAYRVSTECDLEPDSVSYRATVQLDVLRGPVDRVELALDSHLADPIVKTETEGVWQNDPENRHPHQWRFHSNALKPGHHSIHISGRLPRCLGRDWKPPIVSIRDASSLGERLIIRLEPSLRIASMDSGGFDFTTASDEANGQFQLVFEVPRQPLDRTKPLVRVELAGCQVDRSSRLRLDLAKRPFEAVARFDLVVRDGIASQLQFQVPPDWRFGQAKVEPADRVAGVRSQPEAKGDTRVWVDLRSPLRVGETLQVEITAAYGKDVEAAVGEFRVSVPDVSMSDPAGEGECLFEIRLDPALQADLQNLPPPRRDSSTDDDEWRRDYVFSSIPPLRGASIVLGPPKPRVRAAARQEVRWRGTDWAGTMEIDVDVTVGQAESLHLMTNRPLPDNLQWRIAGSGNSIARFESFPAIELDPARPEPSPDDASAPTPPRFNYLLETVVPMRGHVRLLADWSTRDPLIEVPLIELPDADDFLGHIEVRSRTGRILDVSAIGFSASEPDTSSGEQEQDGVVWLANYNRLSGDVSLTLTAQGQSSTPTARRAGRAVARCRSTMSQDMVIHELYLRLDCRQRTPVSVLVPAEAYVWQVELDGNAMRPMIVRETIQITPLLLPGMHDCRVVYSTPVRRWLGLVNAELVAPLDNWDVSSMHWTIKHDGLAYSIAGPSLFRRSALRVVDVADARNPIVVLMSGPTVKPTLTAIEIAFADWVRAGAGDAEQLWRTIGRSLPTGWIPVVDREAYLLARSPVAGQDQLHDWLRRCGLTMIVGNQTVLVTSRVASYLPALPRPDWNSEKFLSDLSTNVVDQGVDASGEFSVPGALPRPTADLNLDRGSLGVLDRNRSEFIVHGFTVADDASERRWDVILVPEELLTRVARILALVSVSAVLVIARRWSPAGQRRMLIVLLAIALPVAVLGGITHHALSLPLWAATATVVVLLLRRTMSAKPATAAVVVALTSLVPRTDAADPPSQFRVLLPTDENGPVGRVIVPQELLRRLESMELGRSANLLLREAVYDGRPTGRGTAAWKARLDAVWIANGSESRQARLSLRNVQPTRMSVDGKPVALPKAGVEAGLSFDMPSSARIESPAAPPRLVRVEVDFETPLVQSGSRASIAFGIPRAAHTVVAFTPVEADAVLDRASVEDGWVVDPEGPESRFSLEGESFDSLNLRYRLGSNAHRPVLGNAESVSLLEMGPELAEFSTSMRVGILSGEVETIDLLAPATWIVSGVEVGGHGAAKAVADWTVHTVPGQPVLRRLTVVLPGTRTGSLTLHMRGQVATVGNGRLQVPWIELPHAASREGTIGVRVPAGWNVATGPSVNVEPSTPAAFVVAWSRIRGDAAPGGIEFARSMRAVGTGGSPSLELVVHGPTPALAVRQTHEVVVRPDSADVEISTIATCSVSGAAASMLSVQIPPGLEVRRVAGAQLRQWFVQDGELRLLPNNPVLGEFVVQISLLGRDPRAEPARHAPAVLHLAPLEWIHANSILNRWVAKSLPGWTVLVPDSPPVKSVRADDGSLILDTIGSVAVALSVRPLEFDIRATSVTLVTVREASTTIEGRIDIPNTRAGVREVVLHTPAGFTERNWDLAGLPSPTSRVAGDSRVWTFSTDRVLGNIVIRWKTSVLVERAKVSVPNVRLASVSSMRRWVAIANTTSRIVTTDANGATSAPLPDEVAKVLGAEGGQPHRRIEAFRADSDDWRITFTVDREPRPSEPYRVLDAEADVFETFAGPLQGISRWQVVDMREGVYTILVPDGLAVDDVFLDGVPLPAVDTTGKSIQFPIFRKGRRQEIVLHWSSGHRESGSTLGLPRLVAGNEPPLVIRVRHPRKRSWSIDGKTLTRVEWLLRRLESRLAEIREAVSLPASTMDDQRFAQRNSEFRALERQIAMSRPDADSRLQLANIVAKHKGLLASHAPPQDDAHSSSSTNNESQPFQSLDLASAEASTYLQAQSFRGELTVRESPFGFTGVRTTNEWVRIAVAALSLVLVVVRPFWAAMRLYWPAPMLAAGVAWWQFADTAFVGIALIVVAVAGATWSVIRWFEGTTSEAASALIRRPSRIHRGLLARVGEP